MEDKIIEAKFSKNKWAIITGLLGAIIFIIGIGFVLYYYLTDIEFVWVDGNFYAVPVKHSCLFHEYLLFKLSQPSEGYPFLIYIGLLIIIVFVFMRLIMNHCSLSIFNTRVTGKASFGKQVDLPINQISAIGLGKFNSITVSTSSGRVNFWLVENRYEVYNALNELLIKLQSESKNNAINANMFPTSTADELKKYKELLDAGIITQEEFEAKKKQLLNF